MESEKSNDETKYRSKMAEENKHIVAGCTTLAPSEYTNRHIKVAVYIHWKIYISIWGYGLLTSTTNIHLKGS
jgi:hypothetical protein